MLAQLSVWSEMQRSSCWQHFHPVISCLCFIDTHTEWSTMLPNAEIPHEQFPRSVLVTSSQVCC